MKLSNDSFLKLSRGSLESFHSLLFHGSSEYSVQSKIHLLLNNNISLKNHAIKYLAQDVMLSDKNLFPTLLKTKDLFAGPELLILTGATDKSTKIIAEILETGDVPFFMVISKEYLKPVSTLRKLYEQQKNLGCMPCYEISLSDLQNTIMSFFSGHGKQISSELAYGLSKIFHDSPETVQSELDKVLLYSQDRKDIDITSLKAILSDVSQTDTNDFINAFLEKNIKKTISCMESGDDSMSQIALLRPLVTALARLHQIKCELPSGTPQDIKQVLPHISFIEQDLVKRRLPLWTESQLELAIKRGLETEIAMKLNSKSSKEIFKFYALSILS